MRTLSMQTGIALMQAGILAAVPTPVTLSDSNCFLLAFKPGLEISCCACAHLMHGWRDDRDITRGTVLYCTHSQL